MQTYLARTAELARETPASRNRLVDFWRLVAIGVVVVGHWLAASIWKQPDGEIALLNSLQWVPYSAWITWLVQVMPVFFLAGGYANARALRRVGEGGQRRRDWITLRTRRLFTPVTPLLLVWVGLIVVLRPFVPASVVYAGALAATVPLWFLGVYISLTAIAPFTHAWWRRSGLGSVLALAAAAIAVDIARFAFEVPGVGWVNFLFVWAAVHQLGYWWALRDDHSKITPGVGWAVAAASLGALIVVTSAGWYPVAMVGVPGAGETNMTPPTFAMLLLGVIQGGIIWGTAGPTRRFVARPQTWHGVVALSGVIMTIYLWHLSAMSLLAAGGLFVFDGALFSIEPGTAAWWVTRPLWVLVLLMVTGLLVMVFARFEWRVSDAPPPRHRRWVTVGVILTAGSAAGVAGWGITSPDAVVHWIFPAAAVVGAMILGALPARKRSRERS